MNSASSLVGRYKGSSLLFVGPGTSRASVDLDVLSRSVDYTASLNDVILFKKTDLYFIGEKFIFNYVRKAGKDSNLQDVVKIFTGLPGDHPTRIDRKYFDKCSKTLKNCYYVNAKVKPKRKKYTLKLSRKFNSSNMNVLSNLMTFPKDASYYLRARSLANSLQICYGLGFSSVYLIGFMDSKIYKRLSYEHQKQYVKELKRLRPKSRGPKDLTRKELANSLSYQRQILKTVLHVYTKRSRGLYTCCPANMDVSGLPQRNPTS